MKTPVNNKNATVQIGDTVLYTATLLGVVTNITEGFIYINGASAPKEDICIKNILETEEKINEVAF